MTEKPVVTFTIWSNGGKFEGGKFEWIVRKNGEIVARSGLIYKSYGAARRALGKHLFDNAYAD